MLKNKKVLVAAGVLLIASAVLFNEGTFGALFRLHGEMLSPPEKLCIRFCELLMVLTGIGIIRYRNTRLGPNLFLSICSLSLFLVAAESYLRLFDQQITPKSGHDVFFEHHGTFGWQFIPNKSGFFKPPHKKAVRVVINSSGMRDREYPPVKPDGKKRIVVLGDSFTSGLEVDGKEVFTGVMEDRMLSDVEVLNFGVNGYGPAQEFLMLRERALRFNPDIVIMVVYVRNDFDDVTGAFDWDWGYGRPRAKTDGSGRVFFENIPVPPPKITRFMASLPERMPFLPVHLMEFIRQRLYDKNSVLHMPPEIRLCKKRYSSKTSESYEAMDAVIDMTNSLCRENNIKFLVVVAPTVVQVHEDLYWNRIKKAYRLEGGDYDLLLPNKKLSHMCSSRNIPILDLTPALRRHAVSGEEIYCGKVQHWNEKGHYAVSGEVVGFLMRNGLLAESYAARLK